MKKFLMLTLLSVSIASHMPLHADATLDASRRASIVFDAYNRGRILVARILLLIQKNLFAVQDTDLAGNTLLHLAVLQGNITAAIDLLNNGFDASATNSNGKTARDILVELVENSMLGDEATLTAHIANLEQYDTAVAALP